MEFNHGRDCFSGGKSEVGALHTGTAQELVSIKYRTGRSSAGGNSTLSDEEEISTRPAICGPEETA